MADTHVDEPVEEVRARAHAGRHPEVTVYYLEGFKEILVPLLLFFSFVKFTLVVLWFMHLRFDSRTYARFFVMGLAGAITLFLIVLLTFQVFSS